MESRKVYPALIVLVIALLAAAISSSVFYFVWSVSDQSVTSIEARLGISPSAELKDLLEDIEVADKVEIYSDDMVEKKFIAGYVKTSPMFKKIIGIVQSAHGYGEP